MPHDYDYDYDYGRNTVRYFAARSPALTRKNLREDPHAVCAAPEDPKPGRVWSVEGVQTSPRCQQHEAAELFDARQLTEALVLFEECTRSNPAEPQHFLNVATTQRVAAKADGNNRKLLRSALTAFGKALQLQPASAGAYAEVGYTYNLLADYDAASVYFRAASSLAPANAKLHFSLGNCEADSGRVRAARGAYLSALRLDPTWYEAYHNLANTYLGSKSSWRMAGLEQSSLLARRLGHPAPPPRDKAASTTSDKAAAAGTSAHADAADESPCEALPHVEAALRLRPSYHLRTAGGVLAFCGRHEEATRLLTKATVIAPRDAATYRDLGAVQQQAGHADAHVALRTAVALAPRDVSMLSDLASSSIGTAEQADVYEEALALDPTSAFHREKLASVQMRLAKRIVEDNLLMGGRAVSALDRRNETRVANARVAAKLAARAARLMPQWRVGLFTAHALAADWLSPVGSSHAKLAPTAVSNACRFCQEARVPRVRRRERVRRGSLLRRLWEPFVFAAGECGSARASQRVWTVEHFVHLHRQSRDLGVERSAFASFLSTEARAHTFGDAASFFDALGANRSLDRFYVSWVMRDMKAVLAQMLDARAYPWPEWLPRAHGKDAWLFLSRLKAAGGAAGGEALHTPKGAKRSAKASKKASKKASAKVSGKASAKASAEGAERSESVQGRPRHHDVVGAPFSWHWQIRGSKRWQLWPPHLCRNQCPPREVTVKCGEMIFIDTDLWDHATSSEADAPGGETSLSIALESDKSLWYGGGENDDNDAGEVSSSSF